MVVKNASKGTRDLTLWCLSQGFDKGCEPFYVLAPASGQNFAETSIPDTDASLVAGRV